MKINILLFLIVLLSFNLCVLAQTEKEKNELVFKKFEKFFNARQTDSVYLLTGDKYRYSLSMDALSNFLDQQLYPLGKIQASSLIGFKDNIGKYKLVFDKALFQLLMNLDKQGKLELFLFEPFKAVVENKATIAPSSNPLKTELDKRVDSLARIYIQKENTVGLVIGAFKDNKITTYSYGETETGSKKLPDDNTLFEIGSITKTFTATLLAYFVIKHKLKLTDSITKFLPDSVSANPVLKGITLLQLATHTSGLPKLPGNLEVNNQDPSNPYKDYDKKLLFSYLKDCKLAIKPGTKYEYSNLAVGLLGTILESVSGKSFEAMVKEIICEPLKMNSTVQIITQPFKSRFPQVHNFEGKPTPGWDFQALAACGSLKSSVEDLLMYARANINTNNLDLKKAFELSHQVYNKEPAVALGWHLIKKEGKDFYWHSGGTYGSSSFIAFDPVSKLAVVVLSNSAESVDNIGSGLLK